MCVVTDRTGLLTIETAPSFVPLTRVSHRNLRSRVYSCNTHADTHLIFFSIYTRQHLITVTKLQYFSSVLFHLLFTATHSQQPHIYILLFLQILLWTLCGWSFLHVGQVVSFLSKCVVLGQNKLQWEADFWRKHRHFAKTAYLVFCLLVQKTWNLLLNN